MRIPVPPRAQLGTGALVLAALAVGQVVNSRLPADDASDRAFEHRVVAGKTLHMRSGDLTVTSIEGARSVTRAEGRGFRSPGVIVVVSFDFTSRRQSGSISYGELRTAGGDITTFSSAGERSSITCPRGQVGILVRCNAVVETDPDTLAGAQLALAPLAIDPRFDDMAIVDLQIKKTMVAQWDTSTAPLEIGKTGSAGMP